MGRGSFFFRFAIFPTRVRPVSPSAHAVTRNWGRAGQASRMTRKFLPCACWLLKLQESSAPAPAVVFRGVGIQASSCCERALPPAPALQARAAETLGPLGALNALLDDRQELPACGEKSLGVTAGNGDKARQGDTGKFFSHRLRRKSTPAAVGAPLKATMRTTIGARGQGDAQEFGRARRREPIK